MKRREFMKLSSLALALTSGMPQFLARAAAKAAEGGKRLVVIQLSGGNDGLNTLVPYSNGAYYAARPHIAVSKQEVLSLNADLGLHPSLKPLLTLWDAGQLALLESVGYPNPNRSHFASMAIWHSADPSGADKEGWIGRIAEKLGDPFCATNIGGITPLALRTSELILPSVNNLDSFQLKLPKGTEASYQGVMSLPRRGEAFFVAQATRQMMSNTARVQKNLSKYKSGSSYPENNKFAAKLRELARLIAADTGQSILYTDLGSFDTDASQRAQQDMLLGDLSSGLLAFMYDLKVQGLEDKVMVIAFSEFGRRVAENDSGGTDHGKGGVMFALGKGVRGGIYGASPDLEKLSDGDISYQQDFRGIYAQALDNWLGIPSSDILGAKFDAPRFIS